MNELIKDIPLNKDVSKIRIIKQFLCLTCNRQFSTEGSMIEHAKSKLKFKNINCKIITKNVDISSFVHTQRKKSKKHKKSSSYHHKTAKKESSSKLPIKKPNMNRLLNISVG
ncbi:MAG: hypothetical protein WA130_07145 [Candidatus Methanoperedens sp.]